MNRIVKAAPLLLLLATAASFAALSPRFLTAANLVNILVQCASIAIVAAGMTFVLLTAGVDLSVGSTMFLAAAVAGKSLLAGWPIWLVVSAVLLLGVVCGAVNSMAVARLRILPFVATLATFYAGRGLALYITRTRALNLPESLTRLGTGRFAGLPLPLWVLIVVLVTAHFILTRTAFGRCIYAVGHDPEAARKAGVNVGGILTWVYVICGLCAAVGGLVAVAQLGSVAPTFGLQREFAAIAAAVLGGTSLFGGRGNVLPGTLIGALLIQMVENGLVMLNTDPYLHPLLTGAVIFVAVLIDCTRQAQLRRLERRSIRPVEQDAGSRLATLVENK